MPDNKASEIAKTDAAVVGTALPAKTDAAVVGTALPAEDVHLAEAG